MTDELAEMQAFCTELPATDPHSLQVRMIRAAGFLSRAREIRDELAHALAIAKGKAALNVPEESTPTESKAFIEAQTAEEKFRLARAESVVESMKATVDVARSALSFAKEELRRLP